MKQSFYARYGLAIMIVAVFLLPFAVVGALNAKKANKNDVKNWVPIEYEETQVYRAFRERFQGEEFILVSWKGCTVADRRLEFLAEKLTPPVEVVLRDGRRFRAYDAGQAERKLTDEEGEYKLAEAYFGRWQLTEDEEGGAIERMPVWANEEIAGDLKNPDEATALGEIRRKPAELFKSVLTGTRVVEQMQSAPLKLPKEAIVARLEGSLFGKDRGDQNLDNRQTCLVATLTEAALRNKALAVETLRNLAVNECAIPAEDLHMGGPPVDNVAIDNAGQKSLNTLAGVAVLIGMVVSWASLRSVKLVVIVIFAGIYSAILSLSIVWWVGSPVDAILFTMPSLVYVATTSGAIHLSNYYRDVIMEGEPAAGAAGKALHHAALPLALATSTTAVGLLTLCYTELVPIRIFGIYSAIGVVVSGLLLVFVIPAALEMWKPKLHLPITGHHEESTREMIRGSGFWWRAGEAVLRNHAIVSLACFLVMGVVGYGIAFGETSVQLMKLLSPRERILADYRFLERELGPLVPMEIVLRVPADETKSGLTFLDRMRMVEDIEHRLKSLKPVGGTMSTVTFTRDLTTKEGPLFEAREEALNKGLVRHRDEFLRGDYLREEVDPASGARTELWRISARVSALENVDYAAFIADLKRVVEPAVAEWTYYEELDGLEDQIAQLVPSWFDASDLLTRGVDVSYTGVVPLVYKAQHSLVDGLVFGFLTDFALIVVVMMIVCRDWSAGIVLLLPSAFPAIVVFGAMGWIHHFLTTNGWGNLYIDIGYVMAPCVALGVTVDDVVHYLLWYRRGIADGMSQQQATMLAYKGCARAMYQSWGVIGIGLSVFALSPFMPTRNFGLMMISMLTVAMIGNLVMMPAILSGFGGRVFAWGIRRKEARKRARAGDAGRPTPGERELSPALTAAGREGIPEPHHMGDGRRRSFN